MRLSIILWPAAILAGWIAVFVLRAYDGFVPWPAISVEALIFMLLWIAVYVAAYLFVAMRATSQSASSSRPQRLPAMHDAIVIAFSIAAMVGAGCLIYEFAVNRGYGLGVAVRDIRIIEVNNAMKGFTGSWLGAFGRLLVSALIVCYALVGYHWHRLGWPAKLAMGLATLVVAYQQAKFEGGRFFLVILLGVGLISYVFRYLQNAEVTGLLKLETLRRTSPGFLVYLAVLAVAVHVYSGYVFLDRTVGSTVTLQETFDTYVQSLGARGGSGKPRQKGTIGLAAGGSEAAQQDSERRRRMEQTSKLAIDNPRLFKMAMTWLYVTQGPNELSEVMAFKGLKAGYGGYTFPQFAQIASKLTGTDRRYDVFEGLPSTGVYVTLPGAFYIDFGWLGGIVCALLLGLATGVAVRGANQGMLAPMALAAPILIMVGAFGPVTSLFANVWTAFLWLMAIPVLTCAASMLWRRRELAASSTAPT